MNCDDVAKYRVKVKYQDRNNASGVIVKLDEFKNNFFIFTAKHTFGNENIDEKKVEIFHDDIREQITFDSYIDLETDIVVFICKKSNLSIIDEIESINIADTENDFTESVFTGYPNNVEGHFCEKCDYHEELKKEKLFRILPQKNTDSYSKNGLSNSKGYSGSGLFSKKDDGYKLVGIILEHELDKSAFHYIALSPLKDKIIEKISKKIKKNNKALNEQLYRSIPDLPSEYLPREKDIREIKKILLEDNNQSIGITGVSKKLGLHGMGGIGKSVFSIALAQDDEVRRYFEDGIYFIELGQTPNIEEIQTLLLSYFDIKEINIKTVKADIDAIFVKKKALLIIDDVWDISHIKDFNIKGKNSKVLITTRQKDIVRGMDAKEYSIDILNKEQSLGLLKKKVGDIEESLVPLAKQILERCGYLPLAINIIGDILKGEDKAYWDSVFEKLENSKLKNLKSTNMNIQHENLYKVIDLSVNYLNSEHKDKYLSLSVFNKLKAIPRITLETYWGEDYLDIIDVFLNSSLLFQSNIRGKILYYVHDLQADYIKESDKGTKRDKEVRRKYKNKYEDNWSDISLDDSYFYNNYKNIFKEKYYKKISEKLLYKEGLALPYLKDIINFLELDKKDIGLKLLTSGTIPDVLIWILGILDSGLNEVQEYAKSYIGRNEKDIHFGLAIRCLDILDSELDEVQAFSKRYIEQGINFLDAGVTIKCLSILDSELDEVQEFSKKYIMEDTSKLDAGIAIKCLDIIDNNLEEIQEFSKRYIEENINNLDGMLAIKCINILGNSSNKVQVFTIKYIEEDIKIITPALAIKCLEVLRKESDKIEVFAKKYISLVVEQDFSNFDNGLLIKCLNVLGDDFKDIKKDFAKNYITKSIVFENFKNMDTKLIMESFEVLDNDSEEIKSFSKKYIEEDMTKNNALLPKCLDVMGKDSKEVKNFSKMYLSQKNFKMKLFLKCLNILDVDLDEVEIFNRIKNDNNLIQKYINIFLRHDVKKIILNINKVSYSKYFKLLKMSPNDLYVMLYHEHKVYIYNKDLGEYARYCNKHKNSEVNFRGITTDEIYDLYHLRAKLLFRIMTKFYLENKNLNYPKNILSNILKTLDNEKLVYKTEIEQLFFDEINNKESDMREKSIVDLANYYNDIKDNIKAIKTIELGIQINLIKSDMFINYAQNALSDAFCKSYKIKKIMGDKYNKDTYRMKKIIRQENKKK